MKTIPIFLQNKCFIDDTYSLISVKSYHNSGGHRYLALLPLMAHSPDRVWMMPVGRLDPPMVMGFVPSYCRIIRTRSLLSSVFGTTGALLTTWLYIAMESLLLSWSCFKGEPTGFICIKRLITADTGYFLQRVGWLRIEIWRWSWVIISWV